MKIYRQAARIDAILETWRAQLAGDFDAYRNHCYRVLNFCLALGGESGDAMDKVSIAVAFHDLGIWANRTYDYLDSSRALSRDYLANGGQSAWAAEIDSMIAYHHKLTRYRAEAGAQVEAFRKADWIDVSRGRLTFGLSPRFIADVISAFPNAGFHARLVALTVQRLKTHPLSPLPMMRL